ncbi:FkbM family methyltransferase, partial [Dehalococcoidia bacterium]|nr:FkbM family methyltransferase [Dehalococcoidia bacterium]
KTYSDDNRDPDASGGSVNHCADSGGIGDAHSKLESPAQHSGLFGLFWKAKKYLSEFLRKATFPLPQDQKQQGFQPNLYIKTLRRIAKLLIALMRLNGVNRFSNEFIQMLDPKFTVELPDRHKITLRTGHGRLLWRARTFMEQEPLLINWIDQFDAEDCFYDIGANIGSFSLYAAHLGIRTFAFEPEFNNLQLLYENIFLNKLQSSCTPIPVALGQSTHLDVFYLKSFSKGDALHSIGKRSILLDSETNPDWQLDSLVMSLDDLVRIFDLPNPTRLKIDVDSSELAVIEGAVNTLEHVQGLYIELHPQAEEHQEIMNLLEKLSFLPVAQELTKESWSGDEANFLFVKADAARDRQDWAAIQVGSQKA